MLRRLRPATRLVAFSLALSAAPLPGASLPAGKKPLTLERITADPPLGGRGVSALRWRDASHFTYLKAEGPTRDAAVSLWEEDAVSGEKRKLLDPVPIPADGRDEKGAKDPKDARPRTLRLQGAVWDEAGQQLLLQGEGDLWLYDLGKKSLLRLTSDAAEEEFALFSPDGRWASYVRKNDLYALELATRKEVRLSRTGGEHVLNGKLDWVYEEELAGRKGGRAYEWSPDSKAIVYLRLDETRVPEYPIVDFLPVNGKLLPQRYPKAGDPNAVPSVHVVEVRGGEAQQPGLSVSFEFVPDDLLVGPGFSWTADGKAACFVTMNREQTRLQATLLPREGGARPLLVETDPAWINSHEPPLFLPDGSGFLFLSERSGFLHAYRYGMDGKLQRAVTKGEWQIDHDPHLDARTGTLFLSATEKDPRERHTYRVKLDGSGFTRVTRERGTHASVAAPGGGYLLDTFSNVDTPPRTVLLRGDGTLVRTVDEPRSEAADYALGAVEMSSFKGPDGTTFYTRLVKPPDFDARKKYPVIVYVYGGPHTQMVQDSWSAVSPFDQLCATKGFLVFTMDGRGSWGRGHLFEAATLKNLGAVELEDQLAGVAELKKHPFVDPARIGIWGWSYGGYMTLYAATHAGATWKAAVAGAPVTHWKYYDSIYTERYMKLPKDNPEGYEASAPLAAAAKLGPKLLLLHGTSDDNVHMQQTMAFVDALMRARKDFTFVPLPRQKHGPREPAARVYRFQRVLEFFEANL